MKSHQKLERGLDLPYRNVGALFTAQAASRPTQTFLICPGKDEETFTYEAFRESVRRAATQLVELGLVKDDRFSLIAPNSSEFLLFYFAGLMLGITVVPINPDLSPDEMQYIVDDSRSRLVLFHPALQAKVDVLRRQLAPGIPIQALPTAAEVARHAPSDVPIPDLEPTQESVIIYTSGTSGNPKGVVLMHLNMLADAKAIAEWFQFTPETRALCVLPLFHNNGQITTLLAPLYAGGSTVIVKGKASLMSLWALAAQYGVTFTSVMASILSILLSIPVERKDRTLKAILCGGQVLTASVQDSFEARFGVPVFEGYGLTETTSFSCINNYPAERRKVGSIGCALPVNDMAILDDHGQEVPPGDEGEICIRGYNVACEYLGLPERNATSFANGWFHSGDYGHMDTEGFFYFHGRRDFLIIKGGENIYGSELENVIFKHDAVAECAVIGIPDKLLGEDLCAFVKLAEGARVEPEVLKAFCRGKIAPYKQAKRIVIIDDLGDLPEIPKGPTKKVLYRVLKEYYRTNLQPAETEK
jgi:acyl-CoA synthetase (AMP-forming)/AMP-acid ligase II